MTCRAHGDRGTATIWMVIGTVIVLAICGLVFDGGLLISAKRDATNEAEAAARAGAQGIDLGGVYANTGGNLDPGAARARAQAFLDSNGWTGTVTADSQTVTVTITRPQQLTFLTMFGLGTRTITGTAIAHPQRGLATH